MKPSVASMARWCRELLSAQHEPPGVLWTEYLGAIPRLDSLADVPSGTAVLVRGDLDAKPGPAIGQGDVRLRSMIDSLQFGRQLGWKQIVFGHIGRKPELSLSDVARRLGELLGCQIPLIDDWLDEPSLSIRDAVPQAIAASAAGSVCLLENTRRYKIERVLWEAAPEIAEALAQPLARLAGEFADKMGSVYVNEAFSAGSLDTSACIVPAAMDRVALGRYVAGEFDGPLRRSLRARLVVFSGLKAEKLDDLEGIVARGSVRLVLSAGSLAMALKKAEAELAGADFCLGVAEDAAHKDKPYFIAPERIKQAKRLLEQGRRKGIEFVLPVDFVLQDGRVSATLGPTDQQFDVGPKTSERFAEKVGDFITAFAQGDEGQPAVAFYNGVFGKFEEPRFEEGSRRFIEQLKRMTDAGIEVYVGGGEGSEALERYGRPDWVTHCFTAGGTVLNALGNKPVPFLHALRMAAER